MSHYSSSLATPQTSAIENAECSFYLFGRLCRARLTTSGECYEHEQSFTTPEGRLALMRYDSVNITAPEGRLALMPVNSVNDAASALLGLKTNEGGEPKASNCKKHLSCTRKKRRPAKSRRTKVEMKNERHNVVPGFHCVDGEAFRALSKESGDFTKELGRFALLQCVNTWKEQERNISNYLIMDCVVAVQALIACFDKSSRKFITKTLTKLKYNNGSKQSIERVREEAMTFVSKALEQLEKSMCEFPLCKESQRSSFDIFIADILQCMKSNAFGNQIPEVVGNKLWGLKLQHFPP